MIIGHVVSTVNVRNKPDEKLSTTSLVGKILANETFEGSELVNDGVGNKWIKLTKLNGVPVDGAKYIASYLAAVKYTVIPDVVVPPLEDLGVPEKITTIEEFSLPDGTVKTRTIIWSNPQVIEE